MNDGQTSLKKTDSTDAYTIGTNVTVVVRVRPMGCKELDQKDVKNCLHVTKNVVVVNSNNEFIFDHCIRPDESNEYLYEQIGDPLLDHALDGYNVCMFAYGQTGSGKTHSITGCDEDPGLMHRFIVNLYNKIAELTTQEKMRFKVKCSYYEIYNEKIHDLLGNDHKTPLRVREHPVSGPYIVDLSTIECSSYEDVCNWINIAQKRRLIASTSMNLKSSRSHTIFTLNITQDKYLEADFKHSITSRVNIVDLAGSERTHLVNATGERLKESVLINKSLLTLGKVITQLAESDFVRGAANTHIPYRESALTWLLKESLGGNSKTTMIATVSPESLHQEETLTTLRYASTARRVVNTVKINEDPQIRRIRELEQEVEVLKQRISITRKISEEDIEMKIRDEVAKDFRREMGKIRDQYHEDLEKKLDPLRRENEDLAKQLKILTHMNKSQQELTEDLRINFKKREDELLKREEELLKRISELDSCPQEEKSPVRPAALKRNTKINKKIPTQEDDYANLTFTGDDEIVQVSVKKRNKIPAEPRQRQDLTLSGKKRKLKNFSADVDVSPITPPVKMTRSRATRRKLAY